jgi:hypothetical protein
LAKTEKERSAAKAAVDKALKSYDSAAGFDSHESLHYFSSDDSASDVKSEEVYDGKRHAQEEGVLEKIESKLDKAREDEVRSTLQSFSNNKGRGASPVRVESTKEGDSYLTMEKMDGDKDSLFKLFTSAEKEQDRDA